MQSDAAEESTANENSLLVQLQSGPLCDVATAKTFWSHKPIVKANVMQNL